MATWTKAQGFVEHMAESVHNLSTGALTIALSNTAPTSETTNPLTAASTGCVLANVTQISYTNVVTTPTANRVFGSVTSSQTSGTYTLDAADMVITATGGAVATFRYIYLYNDTPTSPADPIIGCWDHGSAVTLASGETFTITLNASGILTNA